VVTLHLPLAKAEVVQLARLLWSVAQARPVLVVRLLLQVELALRLLAEL